MGSRKKQRRNNPRATHGEWRAGAPAIPQLEHNGILERHLARKEAEERRARDVRLPENWAPFFRQPTLTRIEDDVNACAMLIGGPMDGEIVELIHPREGDAPAEWWWPVQYGEVKTDNVVWHTRGEQDEEDEMLWIYYFDRVEHR